MHRHNVQPTPWLVAVLLAVFTAPTFGLTPGDVVYRTGGYVNNSDHAGIYFGKVSNVDQVYEIQGPFQKIQRSTFTAFQGGEGYLGAFTVPGMTQSKRDDVLATCAALDADPEISYTVLAAIYHTSNVGNFISVDELTDVRCDGLVEYAYEWNDLPIWGKASPANRNGTPQHHDISYAGGCTGNGGYTFGHTCYAKEHADLGKDEPWQELSPYVQRGGAGTKWTTLRESAALPNVRTDAVTNKTSTSVTLNGTVTDNGGSNITEARFEWTSSSFPGTVIRDLSVSGSTFSYNLTGLQPNTTYIYHAYARNSVGFNSTTNNITFTTDAAQDTTPNAFSFTDVTNADPSTTYVSNSITVSGINTAANISISGGTYSVSGGSYTSSGGTVTNGATVTVRQTSSSNFGTKTSTTLTIGGVSDTYDVTTRTGTQTDTTPDAFAFTDVTNANTSSTYTSNAISVSGINAAATISVTGGSYSVNGGSYTSSSGTVTNGASVTVRQTSSASFSTMTSTVLTIGGVSDSYDVTTRVVTTDTTPDAFTFTDVTNAELITTYTSNIISVSGINAAAAISVTGGSYSVNGGAYTSSSGTVTNGATVSVRLTSSANNSTKTSTRLTIGGVSDTYDVTTKAVVTAPTIGVSPTSLSFSGVAGGGGPLPQTITVSNSGGGTLNWTASVSSGSFLTLAGTTSGAASGSFQVFTDVGALTAGTYNGNIQIAAAGATNTPQNIPVTLTITGTATTTKVIALSGDLAFGDVPVNSTATRTLTITNSGTDTLSVTGISYPSGFSGNWSGTIGPGGSQPVTITFAPTAAQAYSGTITVTSDRTSGTNTASVSGTGASAGGGTLVNGGAHEGTITLRGSNAWTIALAANDTLIAQAGELAGNNSFAPSVEIYNSSGTLVASSWDYAAAFVSHRAQTTGTYRIVVRSFLDEGTGTYQLHAVRAPGTIVVPAGDEGGALTNGAAHEGSITIGDLDAWTIALVSGESLFLQAGEMTGNNSFTPSILLYDPAGALVQSSWDYLTASVSHRAAVAGSYTAVVRSFLTEGTGTYRLHAIKAPGALTISNGDEGGSLLNGGAHEGTLAAGDLDAWTIALSGGDALVVQIGELTGNNAFAPALRLYDPAGQLVQNNWDYSAAQVSHRAILAGNYTVVAYSFLDGGGTYRLHAVKTPGVLATPAGDEGGAITGAVTAAGTITRGDLDAWTITLAGGISFAAQLDEQSGDNSFAPYLRLYDPNGALVENNWDHSGARVSYQTITAGTYTLLVSSFLSEGTGTYSLSIAPRISAQPQAQTVAVGTSVTLQVGVSASPAPTYQWRRNGADIPNATGASLVLTSAQTTDGGSYTVAVTNPAGTVVSSAATVSVASDPNSPAITQRSRGLSVEPGANVTLSAGLNSSASYEWRRNGANIPGAGSAMFTLANMQPAYAGLYQAIGTGAAIDPTIVGVTSTSKVIGTAFEVGQNIYVATNGNTFDQISLQGGAATITADSGQITRISFVDLTNDIVQVEFSGAGTLTLTLDSSSGPAAAANYNQPGVTYMKGHASIVVTGANETTNVSVFSVGRITAVNQSLFRSEVTYDGMADIAYIAIQSTDGKFGGLRAANTTFYAARGLTGIYAPGVQFRGPVFVGDISAFDAATPVLMIGSSPDTRITGGDLLQVNGQAVRATGLTQLKFTAGSTSHASNNLPVQSNRGRLEQDGTDMTAQIVRSGMATTLVNPVGSPQGSAVSVSDDQYVGTRISVTSPFTVTSIKAEARSSFSAPMFVAIVRLANASTFPTASPATGLANPAEVVYSGLFTADPSMAMVSIPASVTLSPGSYAVVFGAGRFGSPGGPPASGGALGGLSLYDGVAGSDSVSWVAPSSSWLDGGIGTYAISLEGVQSL